MQPYTAFKERLGIIDLGSNSARLIVAQYTPGHVYKITDEVSRRVRLSEQMARDNRLHAAAMLRAFDTIEMFQAFFAAQKITHIIPVATAAVRDAANGPEFLAQLRRATGLKFRVLSGEEEAYYGTLGVINSMNLDNGLVIDIGGGSTEIGQIKDRQFVRGFTSTLGAVRLTESYVKNDPASRADLSRLTRTIDAVFQSWDWMSLGKGDEFVGIGGTLRSLARIDRTMRGYPLGLIHGYEIKLRRLEKLIDTLKDLAVGERAGHVPGLSKDRADIILAGAVVVAQAMHRAGARRLRVCGQGLREGLFYEQFLKPKAAASALENVREFSVKNLARLYGYEEPHTAHVSRLALSMFDQLEAQHGYGARERQYLWAAAQLHDIGSVIDYYNHHKHSAYIILGAGMPGFTHREITIIAQMCRYHRRGRPGQDRYKTILKNGDQGIIEKLTSLLRLAEYLDRSRAQHVKQATFTLSSRQAHLELKTEEHGNAQVEVWEALERASLFERAFGLSLEIEEE